MNSGPLSERTKGWQPAQDHQVGQSLEHVGRVEPALDPDRQGLAGELVDHAQHPELASIVCAVLDKVIGPDVVGPLGAATFALKAGVWFRRVRLVMLAPDPRRSSPSSGRKST